MPLATATIPVMGNTGQQRKLMRRSHGPASAERAAASESNFCTSLRIFLKNTAIQCNLPQFTAIHCNPLQFPVTPLPAFFPLSINKRKILGACGSLPINTSALAPVNLEPDGTQPFSTAFPRPAFSRFHSLTRLPRQPTDDGQLTTDNPNISKNNLSSAASRRRRITLASATSHK